MKLPSLMMSTSTRTDSSVTQRLSKESLAAYGRKLQEQSNTAICRAVVVVSSATSRARNGRRVASNVACHCRLQYWCLAGTNNE
jgi:hypothetical protein